MPDISFMLYLWDLGSYQSGLSSAAAGSGVLVASNGYEACPVVICGRELFADFLVIDLPSFDAVFWMDWLGSFFATIDCRRRSVVFEIPDHPRFEFLSGSTSAGPMEYRARPKKATLAAMQVESEKPDVVREFEDMFPDDIYELPPVRAIEFSIDLKLELHRSPKPLIACP
ncbi:uncharacterized protein LOC109839180 [Asparagus officinalis]|uniref:uncharacterized protein LOC109839180 n=1 Tax=Asparagus officinalis TaxID=4686 RepID=UPI00098DE1D0|nr:uncharacterized protein LOC109839180 [Asparagus officinalis]